MKEVKVLRAKNGYVVALDGQEFGDNVVVCNHFDSLVTWLMNELKPTPAEIDRLIKMFIETASKNPEPASKTPALKVGDPRERPWIDWKGNEIGPITVTGRVDFLRRDGRALSGYKADGLDWRHLGDISDIVGYRPAA